MTRVAIRYFAVFREQAGTDREEVTTAAGTARELYDERRAGHGFTLGTDSVRVAINDEFADWNAAISDGDTVVFIPPVAGG